MIGLNQTVSLGIGHSTLYRFPLPIVNAIYITYILKKKFVIISLLVYLRISLGSRTKRERDKAFA
jgi:hypothetical protein